MNTHTPLVRLADLAQAQVDRSGQKLLHIKDQHQAAQHQLDMLKQYYQDYTNMLKNRLDAGLSLSSYGNFLRFIQILETAITRQNKALEEMNHHLSDAYCCWIDQRRRLNAYHTLLARRQHASQFSASRSEQGRSDDASAVLRHLRQ